MATRKAPRKTAASKDGSSKTSTASGSGREVRGEGDELHQQAGGAHPPLTTNQGMPVSDNQNSLRAYAARADAAGRFHPAREDHPLRPRAHPRAHRACARLRGARLLRADQVAVRSTPPRSILTEVGERTPVFTRFSTVAGGAGSVDTPRDVRGFAVKFYTQEGNWDLVGNNIPVFFIQDAMKFPDLVHAVKMEPDRGFPQAGSAHDTFWDFISLTPESMHMIMWAMSDRTHPALAAHDRRLRRPQLPPARRQGQLHLRASSTGGRSWASSRRSGTRR